MTFPPDISKIFLAVTWVSLATKIPYYFDDELGKPGIVYFILMKLLICFTSIITYLNDQEQMLRISGKGLLIEDIEVKEQKGQFSFMWIIIAIIYNPIIPLFSSELIWMIADGITILYLGYRLYKVRKNK